MAEGGRGGRGGDLSSHFPPLLGTSTETCMRPPSPSSSVLIRRIIRRRRPMILGSRALNRKEEKPDLLFSSCVLRMLTRVTGGRSESLLFGGGNAMETKPIFSLGKSGRRGGRGGCRVKVCFEIEMWTPELMESTVWFLCTRLTFVPIIPRHPFSIINSWEGRKWGFGSSLLLSRNGIAIQQATMEPSSFLSLFFFLCSLCSFHLTPGWYFPLRIPAGEEKGEKDSPHYFPS